jgi:hypothetical protein
MVKLRDPVALSCPSAFVVPAAPDVMTMMQRGVAALDCQLFEFGGGPTLWSET